MTFILSLSRLFNQYYMVLYSIQQYLSWRLFLLSVSHSVFFSIFLFCFGLITIFTPCFISMLPLAISYINTKRNNQLSASIFTGGLITSFTTLIVITKLISSSLLVYKLPILSYFTLILVSLDLMQIIDLSKIANPITKSFSNNCNNNTFLQSYLMGIVIGSSSIPCNTSLVLLVISLINNINNLLLVIIYLLIYLFGCICPLFFIFRIKFNYKNFPILSFIWQIFFPLSGSFIFIFSCFSLLKVILI
uniref:Thiol:disulfide interchange protein n=1 Tax=Pleurostichidium falkenbergii TaxID=121064 RepID=A0A4D6UY57_9FLOR|nr:thiol:disulfide interchange protein [Pleurostichidium falkenbergii]QCH39588.1 thiol:disulfide interchange protein [Pleurostichidium falkenbergii]